jgi:hypothetical protein
MSNIATLPATPKPQTSKEIFAAIGLLLLVQSLNMAGDVVQDADRSNLYRALCQLRRSG